MQILVFRKTTYLIKFTNNTAQLIWLHHKIPEWLKYKAYPIYAAQTSLVEPESRFTRVYLYTYQFKGKSFPKGGGEKTCHPFSQCGIYRATGFVRNPSPELNTLAIGYQLIYSTVVINAHVPGIDSNGFQFISHQQQSTNFLNDLVSQI